MKRLAYLSSCLLLVVFVLMGCAPAPVEPTTPPLSEELTLHYFEGGMPQAILDAFTEEYGVAINFVPYDGYVDAVAHIEAGEDLDVVFLRSDNVGQLVSTGHLAELDLSNIPNQRNISVNFRDLIFDPGNRHSMPYAWGTTALVVRSDLFGKPVTSWSNLWDAEQDQAGIWEDPRAMIGISLKSLGYSANSNDPDELEAALEQLIELKQRALFMEPFDPWTSAPELASGNVTIALGWAYDGLAGRDLNPAIEYVIPQEGTLMVLENMVIPANSTKKYTAEVFINFLLRPEIASQFVNETYYAVANESANEFIDPAILNDPIVYPTNDMMHNAELILPLTPEAEALFDSIWDRFMEAPGG